MILMVVSITFNTLFAGLSYMSAFDALDSLQLLGFTPLIAVTYPANANVFFTKLVDMGESSPIW